MTNTRQGGYGHWVVFLIGVVLVLVLIGFFRTDQPVSKISYKAILRLPCGLTVDTPKNNQKITFPLDISGYVNQCGWEAGNGTAGTVQVFDGNGQPVTGQEQLAVPEDTTGYPYNFENSLKLIMPPHTDTGSVIIHGVTGLIYAIPVAF